MHIEEREHHNGTDLCVSFTKNRPAIILVTAFCLLFTGNLVDFPAMADNGVSANSSLSLYSTIISVTPNPASFISGNTAIFTATITDPTNPSSNIIGLVSWSDNGAGGLFSIDRCVLVANHCSLVYTPPTNFHSITITASYNGDSTHSASSGSSSLSPAVTPTPSTTPNTKTTTQSMTPQTTYPQATSPQTNSTQTTSQTMTLQTTSTPTIINATQQKEIMISVAETSQTIAAEVNLVNQTLQTKSIDSSVSVQANNASGAINISVSAPNQTSSKVILFNLENTINVGNLKYLGVMYDGKPIAPTSDINSLFNENSTSVPEYAIMVTQNGAQILVSVPHFSTHTITITNLSQVIPEFPFALPVFLIGFASLLVFSRSKSSII